MSASAATVLTVEDDPIVRADLRVVLEGAGLEVCASARDGVEAVELVREHRPDVVLLDLALPRMDGVEATRRILTEHDVPIVALTGRSRDLAERAVEAGATSYVLKPFAEQEVVGALLDALAIHASASVRTLRETSLRTIAEVLALLGYPETWAVDLERRAFAAGSVWRRAG